MNKERRCKLALIGYEALLQILSFKENEYYRVNNLPKEYKIYGLTHDIQSQSFLFVIESDEYEPIAEGALFPKILLEIEKVDSEQLENIYFNKGIQRCIEIVKEYAPENGNLIDIYNSNIEAIEKSCFCSGENYDNIRKSIQFETLHKEVLKILKFGRVWHFDIDNLMCDYSLKSAYEHATIRMTALILASMNEDIKIEDEYYVPESWWQQFKHELMPKWFTRRFPVKYKSFTKTKHLHLKLCPHRQWDDLYKHVDFINKKETE